MSYNARNTRQNPQPQAQAQGVGRGAAQIMYHQQPSQAGQLMRMPNSAPLPSPYGQNFVAGQQATAFQPSVVAKPPVAPAPAPAALKPSAAYEYQAAQATPTPPKPEPDNSEVKLETEDQAMDGTGETTKRPWGKKKAPGFKINRKVKRRRLNARLRKMLIPKNAIMVLNELKSGVKFTFHEQPNVLAQPLFVVNAEVDGKFHVGQGVSKPLAKQSAAENALKALLLEKMTAAAAAAATAATSVKPETEAMDTETTGNGADDLDDLKLEDDDSKGAQEDDVPWGSLASFALYKLFLDWQNQGTHVPIAKQAPTPLSAVPLKTAPMKQLPDNPTERHPVMLLSQMRPGIKFTEKKREGSAPNLVFTLEVTVEGVSYEGVAKNKKDAKKEAAKAALSGCLGISYDNTAFST